MPDAAKIALATAGRIGGSDGSPRPVGGLFDLIQCASITGGACAIRSSGMLVEVALHRLRRP